MTASGIMKYTVIVRHPETDAPIALLAGEPVPDWAVKLVESDDVDGAARPTKK